MKKLTDEKREEIARLCRAGLPLREIAARVGCSHVTVAKWIERAAAAEKAAPEAAPRYAGLERDEPEPSPAPAPVPPLDDVPLDASIDYVRRALRESFENAKTSRETGNTNGAQKSLRDVAMLSAIAARLEKQQKEGVETHSMTKDEIDAQREKIRERVAAYQARGLRCADCGRALAASWAGISIETMTEKDGVS